jgi:hypothetical protein
VPRVSTAVYDLELLPPTDPEWTVYEAFEGVQNGNRLGFSAGPQDFKDECVGDITTSGANDDWNSGVDDSVDEDFLNGLDDDGDNQIDEDYEAIGQQMFSCQYWDVSQFAQESNPDHEPLGILIQQRSFAWATSGANEFVGFDFKIWNIGNETLNDVFIAFFVDADAGPKDRASFWVDDKGGFVSKDTVAVDESIPEGPCRNRRISFDICYLFDTPDVQISEEQGGVKGGDVPGFFGGMFLGHTVDPLGVTAPSRVGIRRGRFYSADEGDPPNDIERYRLISGEGVPSGVTTRPGDYRYIMSAGPFVSLPPDTFLTFQTAFVIGDGLSGMIENAVQAQVIFDGAWRNVDECKQTGVEGRETCLRPAGSATSVLWNDPCDSLDTEERIDWAGYCAPDNFRDNDCDECTPRQSENGHETRINWVGTVAPPPPNTNTGSGLDPSLLARPAAGNRRVVLQWDNLSELKADPIQRRILFEGYRVWRVEGWQRPVGSTGPSPEEWQMLEQIVRHPVTPPDTCLVPNPRVAGDFIVYTFNQDYLGNWAPQDPNNVLPDDACDACPHFCWPYRPFFRDTTLAPLQTGIATADTTPGMETADLYPIGYYTYVDTAGVKNGMIYFYDVTAFSAWDEEIETPSGDIIVRHFELSGRPAARETEAVVPTWPAQDTKNEIYVVPNPYVQGDRSVVPWGWDLIPSKPDPTGTRIAFTNLPVGRNVIKIYTLSGDLVQTIENRSTGENGTAFWNLVTRNGQDVTAGIYLFTVKTENQGTKVGRFVVIR